MANIYSKKFYLACIPTNPKEVFFGAHVSSTLWLASSEKCLHHRTQLAYVVFPAGAANDFFQANSGL